LPGFWSSTKVAIAQWRSMVDKVKPQSPYPSGGPGGERLGSEALAELPRESVARILRQTRASYGQSLESVAESLRIRLVHLKAIEDGRYEDLPGVAYAVGFVGTYADYLRLDREEIVRQFKEEIQGQDEAIQLVFPTPSPEGKVPGGAIILVSVLLVALIYGIWFYLSNQDTQLADLVPDVPERLQTLLGSDEPDEFAEPSEAAEPPAAEVPAVSEAPESVPESGPESVPESVIEAAVEPEPSAEMAPEPPVEVAAASPETAEGSPTPPEPAAAAQGAAPMSAESPVAADVMAAPESPDPSPVEETTIAAVTEEPAGGSTAEVAPTALPAAPSIAPSIAPGAIPAAPSGGTTVAAIDGRTPRVYGSDNAQSRITLHATLDSWVQVRDGQGDLLLTRVLRPGDSYRVPDQTGLTLVTGNAGGLRIEVDGTALAPIGRVGMVRRNIALDPQRLVEGTASP
jgi:cytoskeletal protein RodZ